MRKHRLEHQPQLVHCGSRVTILLVASIRALKTTELRTLRCAAPGPMNTGALRQRSGSWEVWIQDALQKTSSSELSINVAPLAARLKSRIPAESVSNGKPPSAF